MQGGSVKLHRLKPAPAPESGSHIAPASGATDFDMVAVALLMGRTATGCSWRCCSTTAAAAYLAFTTPPTHRADVVVTEVHDQGMGGAAQLANQISGLSTSPAWDSAPTAWSPIPRPCSNRIGWFRNTSRATACCRGCRLARGAADPVARRAALREGRGFHPPGSAARRHHALGRVDRSGDRRALANGLVGLANELLRTRALEEAQRNIAYLNAQADRTNEVELRRAIFNLIESETKTLMLANGRTEYAFRVVDPAVPPEDPFRSAPHTAARDRAAGRAAAGGRRGADRGRGCGGGGAVAPRCVVRSPAAGSASRWSAAAASPPTTSRRSARTTSARAGGRVRHRARGAARAPPRPAPAASPAARELLRRQRRRRRRAVATPSGLHPAAGDRAARAGRHVMTEKPMATRWQTACDGARPATRPACSCSSSSRTAATPRCSC